VAAVKKLSDSLSIKLNVSQAMQVQTYIGVCSIPRRQLDWKCLIKILRFIGVVKIQLCQANKFAIL